MAVITVVAPAVIPAVVPAVSDAYYAAGAAVTVAGWRVSAALSNVVRCTPVQAATLEKEASSSGFTGGAYGKIPKNGGQNHHMPADSVSPFSTYKGPALNMSPEDHRLTASWGNSLEAQMYRAQQADLISQGMFKEAQQMDINDVMGLFGNKYANGIKQMVKYTVSYLKINKKEWRKEHEI